MQSGQDVRVEDHAAKNRFEITVDGHLAGFADYRIEDGVAAFPHTEIDPAYGGRGLGTVLVHHALDAMRERGIGVLPYCSFVHRIVAG